MPHATEIGVNFEQLWASRLMKTVPPLNSSLKIYPTVPNSSCFEVENRKKKFEIGATSAYSRKYGI